MDTIAVSALSYSIGDAEILRDVSLSVQRGEFLGVIGPNGSGKSTLVKHICRHILPQAGHIHIHGEELSGFSHRGLAGTLAVVAQESESAFDFTVKEVLQMGRYHKKGLLEGQNEEDGQVIAQALAQVGLPEFASRSFLSLSGGEKQRILIARALVQDTEVLVLDEPTKQRWWPCSTT